MPSTSLPSESRSPSKPEEEEQAAKVSQTLVAAAPQRGESNAKAKGDDEQMDHADDEHEPKEKQILEMAPYVLDPSSIENGYLNEETTDLEFQKGECSFTRSFSSVTNHLVELTGTS